MRSSRVPRAAAIEDTARPRLWSRQATARLEEEEPQTQMAAAFAALKLEEKLTSDTPPEETKA